MSFNLSPSNPPFAADPADDWDEDDGYEYDDTKPACPEEDEDEGIVGIGLVVAENGDLAIVHALGVMDYWKAIRVSDTEAGNLAAMIEAVLG